jgi:hypothetical protein
MKTARSLRHLVLAGAAALALGACATTSGPKVRVDADPTANMASYGSYSFIEPFGTDRSGYSTPLGNAVKQAVRREMDVRGLRYMESGGDLLVNAGAMSRPCRPWTLTSGTAAAATTPGWATAPRPSSTSTPRAR